MKGWSAAQYTRFENERTRPVYDLLAMVRTQPVRRAIDLGCGPGNSTEALAEHYPNAEIQGLDSSENMIAEARRRLPELTFAVADLGSWHPAEKWDLIFGNAVFHWIPKHETVFPRLIKMLEPGGSLAIQIPDNENEPTHLLMREIANDLKWKESLKSALSVRTKIESPSWYYNLLRNKETKADIWRTTYYHPVKGIEAIVEWFKGSGLRPFLSALNEQDQVAFLNQYRHRLAEAYPIQPDGNVLLAFPRLFMIATSQR